MKNRRYTPMLIAAGLLSVMSFGSAYAAPADKPAKKERPARKPMVPKRIVEAIEAKTGKPLTDDQKAKLGDAAKARQDALEAANEKYLADIAAATGLTVDDVRTITTPARRNGNAAKPDAPKADAPATATP